MTKEELTENVAKCYNSLPDKSEDAMKTLISTIAYFIAMNVNREESSIDEVITYFRNALVYGWNYKLASDDLQFISE